MLNIIKSKIKNTYKKKALNGENIVYYNKDFVPAVRNWKNSIYVYNKNTLSLIPVASRLVMKLIKGYFNSYNLNIESKIREKRLRRRYRKLSTNKIFISQGEFKHTNDKINITLYVYNKQKLNYITKLSKRYTRLFKKLIFKKKIQLIKSKAMTILNKQKINRLKNVLPEYSFKVNNIQNLLYKNYIKKSIKRLKYYMYYKQLLYINKAKFENSYLQGLIELIKKIFNKNIEFNIINLKYLYFNSDIYTQPLVLKLRKKRNAIRYLKQLVNKAKIKKVSLNERSKYYFNLENVYKINNQDTVNNLLNKLMQYNKINSEYLKKVILSDIKYKRVSGVRLETSGRLTKRYTASRSQYKFKYKGNLVNTYSSLQGQPSSLIRGNDKPNLQYTKLNSKTRIGSFGVKGWVNGV